MAFLFKFTAEWLYMNGYQPKYLKILLALFTFDLIIYFLCYKFFPELSKPSKDPKNPTSFAERLYRKLFFLLILPGFWVHFTLSRDLFFTQLWGKTFIFTFLPICFILFFDFFCLWIAITQVFKHNLGEGETLKNKCLLFVYIGFPSLFYLNYMAPAVSLFMSMCSRLYVFPIKFVALCIFTGSSVMLVVDFGIMFFSLAFVYLHFKEKFLEEKPKKK